MSLVVLAVFLVTAASAGATELPPPGVRSNPAWLTVTKGPSMTATLNTAALTPLGVFDGLKMLGPGAAVIWATTLRKGAFPRPFKRAAWPPRLAEFRLDHSWEGQPLPRIQQRLLALTTHGWSLDVRVYFGTQRPGRSLLAAVQAELSRLTLPGP